MPSHPNKKPSRTKVTVLGRNVPRKIGEISFDCYETGQKCTMDVFQSNQSLQLKPRFKIPLDQDLPMTVTQELWNRWANAVKQQLEG